MAIKGLTDRNAMFPEIGQIRKGAKKTDANKPGPDLDHFRFVAPTDLMRSFVDAFGDKPQEIRFISPFETTAEVFEAWREEYGAGSLKHRCDGHKTVIRQLPNGSYSNDPIDCPGGCKQVGRLKIVIPALKRLGFVTVHTTSIWDILTIWQNLSALEMLRGSLRGIPLVLRRVKRSISTPSGSDGKRARRDKWLLTIEAAPEWVEKQLDAMQRAALPSANEPLMLTDGGLAPDVIDDENDDETEQLCSPQTAAAITELWTVHGAKNKAGQIIPLPQFLKKQKGVDSLAYLPADSAVKLLNWLQEQALPAAEEKKFGWACEDKLAAEIEALTKDLVSDGVTDDQWQAELAEFMGQDRAAKVDLSTLTNEQAQEWIRVLKSWVTSRETVAEAA